MFPFSCVNSGSLHMTHSGCHYPCPAHVAKIQSIKYRSVVKWLWLVFRRAKTLLCLECTVIQKVLTQQVDWVAWASIQL